MAIERKRTDDELAPQTLGPSGGIITPGAASSGGGVTPGARPTASGSFTNLSAYVAGAKPAAERLGGTLARGIGTATQEADTAIGKAGDTVRTAIAGAPTVQQAQDIGAQFRTKPADVDEGVFKSVFSGEWEKPDVTGAYTAAGKEAGEAAQYGRTVTQPGGYEALQQEFAPGPMTKGQRGLDAYLLSRTGAAAPVREAGRLAVGAPERVTSAITAGQEQADIAQKGAVDAAKTLQDMVNEAVQEYRTGLGEREKAGEAAFRKEQADIAQKFGQMTTADVAMMDANNPPDFMVKAFGDRAGDVIRSIQNTLKPSQDWYQFLRGYVSPETVNAPPGLQYAPPESSIDIITPTTLLSPEASIGPENVITPEDVAMLDAWAKLLKDTGINVEDLAALAPAAGQPAMFYVPQQAVENMLAELVDAQYVETERAAINLVNQLKDIDSQLGAMSQGWLPPDIAQAYKESGWDSSVLGNLWDERVRLLNDTKAYLLGQPTSRPPSVVGTGTPVDTGTPEFFPVTPPPIRRI